MAKDDAAASYFIDQLCKRTQELRLATGKSQAEMAELLGIPLGRHQKYEIRSAIPHYLIPRFAALTGGDIAYVITGRSQTAPPRKVAGVTTIATIPRVVNRS